MTKEQLLKHYEKISVLGELKESFISAISQAYDIGFEEGNQNGLKVASQITEMVTNSFKK